MGTEMYAYISLGGLILKKIYRSCIDQVRGYCPLWLISPMAAQRRRPLWPQGNAPSSLSSKSVFFSEGHALQWSLGLAGLSAMIHLFAPHPLVSPGRQCRCDKQSRPSSLCRDNAGWFSRDVCFSPRVSHLADPWECGHLPFGGRSRAILAVSAAVSSEL